MTTDAAATTTTAPAPDTAVQSGAQQATQNNAAFDWKTTGFDDDGLGYVANKGWKGPGDMLASYRNLEKLTGVPADKLVRLPTDASPEAWNEVYTKLGRPESADKYEIPVPEGDTGEFAKTAASWFHEAGLSNNQATKLAERWNKHVGSLTTAQTEAQNQKIQTEVNALKSEWGGSFDANMQLVERAAEAFQVSEQQLIALKSAMGPAAAMKFMHGIGSKLGVEDNGLIGQGGGGTGTFGGVTPQQALSQINELRNDRAFVQQFTSQDPKTRGEARAKMDRLHKLAYPDS